MRYFKDPEKRREWARQSYERAVEFEHAMRGPAPTMEEIRRSVELGFRYDVLPTWRGYKRVHPSGQTLSVK